MLPYNIYDYMEELPFVNLEIMTGHLITEGEYYTECSLCGERLLSSEEYDYCENWDEYYTTPFEYDYIIMRAMNLQRSAEIATKFREELYESLKKSMDPNIAMMVAAFCF